MPAFPAFSTSISGSDSNADNPIIPTSSDNCIFTSQQGYTGQSAVNDAESAQATIPVASHGPPPSGELPDRSVRQRFILHLKAPRFDIHPSPGRIPRRQWMPWPTVLGVPRPRASWPARHRRRIFSMHSYCRQRAKQKPVAGPTPCRLGPGPWCGDPTARADKQSDGHGCVGMAA